MLLYRFAASIKLRMKLRMNGGSFFCKFFLTTEEKPGNTEVSQRSFLCDTSVLNCFQLSAVSCQQIKTQQAFLLIADG
jgi:hypothetical protein